MIFHYDPILHPNPEELASAFLDWHYCHGSIPYPVNPFELLKKEGVLFSIRNLNKLEGVYIPASSSDDIAVVGINGNRPVTRQRFTAAHELCHHLKDADKQFNCFSGNKNEAIEKFADKFAAAILMPINELKKQVDKYKDKKGNVSFEDILTISQYFGVSFLSCVARIAYKIHAIEGDTEYSELKARVDNFKPEKRRKGLGLSYVKLYEQLFSQYEEQLRFIPSDRVRLLFQNEYIYNDSRLEGLKTDVEKTAEIVTDLRLKSKTGAHSEKANEYMSIAGHYDMYQSIFSEPEINSISVFETVKLNRILFSYYPYPEYGGKTRTQNTLVVGAKFNAVDYTQVMEGLRKLDKSVREKYSDRHSMSICDYIKHVAEIHYKLTVIHPFADGNGRTARAFMNLQLFRYGLPPIYIKVNDKKRYIEALSIVDKEGKYDSLYEIVFEMIIQSHMALSI